MPTSLRRVRADDSRVVVAGLTSGLGRGVTSVSVEGEYEPAVQI